MSIGTFIIVSIVKILLAVFVLMTAVAYTTLLERKVVAHLQNRWGPTRVGPFGIWQPLADGLKFIFKEDVTPPFANKPLYLLAPVIALVTALTSMAVIPIGPWISLGSIHTPLQITDVNIGLLIILGITSVGVYGGALAGWASNSKYSMLASLRASAQMISYEVALGLSLVGVLILSGSFSLREIVDAQSGTWLGFIPKWNIFQGQIVAFFIYIMAAYAETNRIPFDLAEAETELVGGYHTEYSSMKFAMFFMAEYANMFTVACLASIMFLGRMVRTCVWAADPPVAVACGLVRCAGVCFHFCLHLGARHVAAVSLRPAYGFRLEVSPAAGDCEYCGDGIRGCDEIR